VRVGIVGFVGSGRTTLLGALLHHLARGGGKESSLAYHGLEGADSFRDLFGHADALERGEWPPRTTVSRVCEYTLLLRDRATGLVLELKLPEMSSAHVEEIWKTDRIPAEVSFVKDYQGLLLLVDATVVAPERMVAQLVRLLQAIKRAQGWARWDRSPAPVAIVFTKWDALPEDERKTPPEELARTVVPLLLDFLESNHSTWKVFGVSAVGGTDALGRPLLHGGRLRPLSLLGPFEWAQRNAK